MLLLLLACGTPATSPSPSDKKNDSPPVEEGPQPAELAPLSGDCPAFTDKGATFTSNGLEREVFTYLPDNPEGAPVMFYFHPLGGNARQMAQALGLARWATANGVVVIVPNSKSDNLFEWDFWNGQEDDFFLYDDLRTCAAQNLGVDIKRIYLSGFSAGALWTSYLSTRRGDTVAAILPFSGGDGDVWQYETPDYTFPALLPYGGDSDIYSAGPLSINFEEAVLQFAGELSTDGHTVAVCNHNSGHTLPPETMDITTAWLLPHVFGEDSPFAGGLEGFPSWCDIGPEPVVR